MYTHFVTCFCFNPDAGVGLVIKGTLQATVIKIKAHISILLLSSVLIASKNELQAPNFIIYTAMIDEQLNDKGYIVPGFGDTEDRAFGTH